MINTNEAWRKIAIDPYHRTTFSLLVDGKEVPPSRIAVAPEITSALYTDRWGVGNVSSSCIKFTYLPLSTPPKAAKVQLKCTVWPRDGDWVLVDETREKIVSGCGDEIWLMDTQTITLGTWYVNTRSTNAHGWLTLECYDKMLKLDRYTVKKAAKKHGVSLKYPVGMETILSLAAKVTGLTAPDLEDASGVEFTKDDVTELTMREALGYAATANGVNLAADEAGKTMRALYYTPAMFSTAHIEVTFGSDIDELVSETGEYIVFYDEDSASHFLDRQRMAGLALGDTLPEVTKVEVSGPDDDDTWSASAEEATSDGTTYTVEWPLSCASQQIANQIVYSIGHFVYTPWDASNVLLDPSVQVGDPVIVDGVETVVAEITARCSGAYVADCGAAGNYEIEEEL